MKSYAQRIADEIAAEAIDKFEARIAAKIAGIRRGNHSVYSLVYNEALKDALDAIRREKEAAQEELGG